MSMGYGLILVAGLLGISNPSQEAPFQVLAEQVVDHVAATWPDKTVVISDLAGDLERRESWTSQLTSLATARDMETISPSDDPNCRGGSEPLPDAQCYFPRPRDHVVLEFVKAQAAEAAVTLNFRAYIQGDPVAGFVAANFRADFEQNTSGEWILSEVRTSAE